MYDEAFVTADTATYLEPPELWPAMVPPRTLWVNQVIPTGNQGCKLSPAGEQWKWFGCGSLGKPVSSGKSVCKLVNDETIGLDEPLPLRQRFGMPTDLPLVYSTRREILGHDLGSLSAVERAKLVPQTRPSDKWALGRRADMHVYFETIRAYDVGRGQVYAQVDMYSGACCDSHLASTSAEGRLCFQLGGSGVSAVKTPHGDFF
jgi:hypothetical protein